MIKFILKNSLPFLLILVLILSIFLITTETGFQVALWALKKSSSTHLTIKDGHGKLYSAFTLQGVRYENQNQLFTSDVLYLKWHPLGLLLNKLSIEDMTLSHAHVIFKNTQSSSTPLDLSWTRHFLIKKFKLDHLSLVKGHSRFEFDGSYLSQWNGNWRVNIPNLQEWNETLSGSLSTQGTMKGTLLSPVIIAHIQANNIKYSTTSIKKMKGDATLYLKPDTPESKLVLTANDFQHEKFKLSQITLEIAARRASKNVATSQFTLSIDQHYTVAGKVDLPKFTTFFDMTQPISGKFTTRTNHLEWLTTFYPEIKQPQGTLEATLLLDGMIQHPTFTTHITLTNGKLDVPSIGLAVNKILLDAQQQNNSEMYLKGKFQSGQGQAEMTGNINWRSDPVVHLDLKGKNLQCVNLKQYKITASPSLRLSYAKQLLKIEGDIPIDSAEIVSKNATSTVSLPDEVVFVEEKPHKTQLPLTTAMNIKLKVSNPIYVVYNDLQAYLKGHVSIQWLPKRNPIAIGELYAVKGSYTAFGQTLSISEGRLIFTGGPLSNPGLSIHAGKQVKTVRVGGQSQFANNTLAKTVYAGTEMITVGFQVLGTFDRQLISFFSNPTGLSQNDILSYLTFGYPQSQISDPQNKSLLSALSVLNLGGTQKLSNFTNTIQNKLGLTEMNIESREVFNKNKVDSATSFVVGKQIFNNLYAHYSIGLSDSVSTLNLRYQLNKYLAIQSETSKSSNGADLLYSIERD